MFASNWSIKSSTTTYSLLARRLKPTEFILRSSAVNLHIFIRSKMITILILVLIYWVDIVRAVFKEWDDNAQVVEQP